MFAQGVKHRYVSADQVMIGDEIANLGTVVDIRSTGVWMHVYYNHQAPNLANGALVMMTSVYMVHESTEILLRVAI